MTQLIFLKLGGSFITDKREAHAYRDERMLQAAQEIASAYSSEMRLLIGHGSGSFGHVTAAKYGTAQGVQTTEQWHGFAEVSLVARRLNALVLEALYAAGLPVIGFQPSASAHAADGRIEAMETALIQQALDRGLIPLVHGDVAFDRVRGGTIISTETVFAYLAAQLRPTQILLLGEVEGVYDAQGQIIPHITPHNFPQVAAALGGSHGADVTGGMASKVRDMLDLAQKVPNLHVRIVGGTRTGQLESILRGGFTGGTLISAS